MPAGRAVRGAHGPARAFQIAVSFRHFLVAPVLLTALSFAPSSHAEERAGDLERARALFDEAGELERQGQWPAAQERLRGALRIRETANLRYALGWALENDGKRIEARAEYETALRLAKIAGNDEVSQLASTRIAELDRQTPQALLSTKGENAPAPAPVLPWVLVGGGGALVVGAVVLLASSAGDASTRDDNMTRWCDATACAGGATATRPETPEAAAFRREAYDAATRGNTKQLVGGVFGGVGAVSIGVGVYLLLRKEAREETAKAASASRLRIDAAPLAGGGMAGASFSF